MEGTVERRRSLLEVRSSRSVALWAGIGVPPLAWIAHVVLGDLIFELGCSRGVLGHALFGLSLDTWALIQTALLGAACALAGLASLAAWRRLRAESDGVSLERARGLALAGMASAALYLTIIAYGFVPQAFLGGCGR